MKQNEVHRICHKYSQIKLDDKSINTLKNILVCVCGKSEAEKNLNSFLKTKDVSFSYVKKQESVSKINQVQQEAIRNPRTKEKPTKKLQFKIFGGLGSAQDVSSGDGQLKTRGIRDKLTKSAYIEKDNNSTGSGGNADNFVEYFNEINISKKSYINNNGIQAPNTAR